jgi:hypothetical protein
VSQLFGLQVLNGITHVSLLACNVPIFFAAFGFAQATVVIYQHFGYRITKLFDACRSVFAKDS